jgi:hypothetical protein
MYGEGIIDIDVGHRDSAEILGLMISSVDLKSIMQEKCPSC